MVASANEIADIQKLIAHERAERQKREESFIIERDQHQREHETAIRREREAGERAVIEVGQRCNEDIRILKQEHSEIRNAYDNKIEELQMEYKALEERWLRRESRPEDLQRISMLENEMKEKDALVVKTREEMMYFKREMLNREENYNKKFGASPNGM